MSGLLSGGQSTSQHCMSSRSALLKAKGMYPLVRAACAMRLSSGRPAQASVMLLVVWCQVNTWQHVRSHWRYAQQRVPP